MPDLSDSVNWSEIDSNNNNAPPNGWPEGMMPSGVNDAARADRGALKRFWDRVNPVQTITPSGGLWTFTTGNPAYPTAYVNGEIYCFHPTAGSVGGDLFQVNGISPTQIVKRVGPGAGSFSRIIAQDIVAGVPAQIVYDAAQNTGAGAFILLNPFVPISGDGAGGVSVPGGLTVAGDFITTGSIVANGGTSVYGDLQVTGQLSVTGYKSRSGTGGPYQTNLFNIEWTGADGAHLWIDAADQGPIVCAPGGDIVVGGNITASGDLAAHTLTASGGITVTGGGVNVQGGLYVANGNLTVAAGNLTTSGDLSAHTVTASGGIAVSAGGVNIQSGGLNVTNDIGAHTVTASGGVTVSAGGINIQSGGLAVAGATTLNGTTNAQSINPTVNNLHSLGVSGQAWFQVTAYAFPNASDPALKRDIAPVPPGCLDLVRTVTPQTFKWKSAPEGEENRIHWGFMAPEIARAMDRAGHQFDAVRVQNGLMSLEYNALIAVLWAAVRELSDKLEARG